MSKSPYMRATTPDWCSAAAMKSKLVLWVISIKIMHRNLTQDVRGHELLNCNCDTVHVHISSQAVAATLQRL